VNIRKCLSATNLIYNQLKGITMKSNKLIANTLLLASLFAIGISHAQESTTTTTSTAQKETYGTAMRARIANMSREERKAFFADIRTRWDSMTPEERVAVRDMIRSPIAGMSKQEREAFRAQMKEKFDKMTPAEKDALRAEHMQKKIERMEHRMERPERAERPAK
jgi:hypothetical protein